MKKFLSILLFLCMVLSLVSCYTYAEGITDSGTEKTDDGTTDEATLEMFGFNVDKSAFKLDSLKNGKHIIDAKYELLADFSGYKSSALSGNTKIYNFEKAFESKTTSEKVEYTDTPIPSVLNVTVNNTEMVYNVEKQSETTSTDVTNPYEVSTVFDPAGSGKQEYMACLSIASKGGEISLTISRTDSATDSRVLKVRTGYITTSNEIKMWLVEGLLSLVPGDFDGDGKEELAIYAPVTDSSETTTSGFEMNINISKFNPSAFTINNIQTISLTDMGNSGKTCTWNHSFVSGKQQYYSVPYMALTADDVNGDGIDDLMTVMNFSTRHNGIAENKKYTTSEVLDPTSCFASLLNVYEGREGGNLVATVLNKPLVANGMGDDKYRYVLRHANAVVADVTGEGSREIVFGGNYTKIDYQNKTVTGTTTVNTTREAYRYDDLVFGNILGFARYEDIVGIDPATAGSPYSWYVQSKGCTQLHHYVFSDNNPIQQPVTLCGYKRNGSGRPDTIFLAGQLFEYNQNDGELTYIGAMGTISAFSSGYTNKWLGKASAANCGDEKFGTEMLVVPMYGKVTEEEKYTAVLAYSYNAQQKKLMYDKPTGLLLAAPKYSYYGPKDKWSTISVTSKWSGKFHVNAIWVNSDESDTSYIEYQNGDTDIYYSQVEVLAIMQAPPLYGELNDDNYIGNSATGFAKSSGSSSGSSLGGSLTAGVVAGFEHETSFLGLFKCAGAEYEFKLTGTISKEKSTETSYDYSTGFETSGTSDVAVIFTVPYVRYNCKLTTPKYVAPTEEEYIRKCEFRDELKTNIEEFVTTGVPQNDGKYLYGIEDYDYRYYTNVDDGNYGNQIAVLDVITKEIEAIENAVIECGKGGDKHWGETVGEVTLPYHYCIPQSPILTTVDVSTYDSMADYLGMEKISEKVFGTDYVAGDPNTYAHTTAELNYEGKVLSAKNNLGEAGDGFLSNSNISSAASSQSQSITVETADSSTLGWGTAVENTSVATVGGAKIGFTACVEVNGSVVETTTEGMEYSGTVVGLPDGTPASYSYYWKLVSYNSRLNGKKVPVVGYLTKITTVPPPSVAQNISVENLTDTSATLTWENGARTADFYKISRVDADGNNPVPIANNIVPVDGKCSYDISNLQPSGITPSTSYYVIESYTSSGKKSIASEIISVTTMPEGFAVAMSVEGIENVIYRDGKNLSAKLNIDGNEGYDTFYQWQVSDDNDWVDLDGQTAKTMNFKISTLDNNKKVRCTVTMFIGSRSYKIYTAPITLHCARTVEGYSVDWAENGNSVTITPEEGATPANVYLKAENANGISKIMHEPSSANGVTFNTSDVASDGMRIYIWENNLAPVTLPFVK